VLHEQRQTVRARAGRLLAPGGPAAGLLPRGGRVRTPIPVREPGGRLHSWFVPLTAAGRLAGFLQLLPVLRRPGQIEGCPEAGPWIDPAAVAERAAAHLRRGERAGRPYLTYDRHPARLAWAVPVTGPRGTARTVFVAGDHVYTGARGETGIGGRAAGIRVGG
jgi:hypothetical protein